MSLLLHHCVTWLNIIETLNCIPWIVLLAHQVGSMWRLCYRISTAVLWKSHVVYLGIWGGADCCIHSWITIMCSKSCLPLPFSEANSASKWSYRARKNAPECPFKNTRSRFWIPDNTRFIIYMLAIPEPDPYPNPNPKFFPIPEPDPSRSWKHLPVGPCLQVQKMNKCFCVWCFRCASRHPVHEDGLPS